MVRTAVTLLLVSCALASADPFADNFEFLKNKIVQGKGAVQSRVVKPNANELVADVPEKESSIAQILRVARNDVFSKTLQAAIYGNQLDDQKTYELPITGRTVTWTFGKASPAENINLQLSFENDAFFVYGKTKCATAGACRKDAPKATYTEVAANKQATSFNYMSDAVKGDDYKDSVGLNKDAWIDMTFGVATFGDKAKNVLDVDGYVGLGFNVASGHSYTTISTLLAAVTPSRALTIWKKDDLSSGVINVGATTYKSCPKKSTVLKDALANKVGVQQWWFTSEKVEVDGQSIDNKIVKINLDFDNIGLPKALIAKIRAKMTSNYVDDPSKLPNIKITIGKDVVEIEGSSYATKVGDKNYTAIFEETDSMEYQVSLGNSILNKNCIVLKQKDDGKSYQIGLIYSENFSPSSKFSVFALIMLPFVYFMGL